MRVNIKKDGKTTVELSGMEAGLLTSALALIGSTTNLLEISDELNHLYELLTLNFQHSTDDDWEKIAVEELIARKQKAENAVKEAWDKLKALKEDAGITTDEDLVKKDEEKFDA